MKKVMIVSYTLLVMMLPVTYVHAQTATDLIRKYIGIESAKKVDEYAIKEVLLHMTPKGTVFNDVLKKLEGKGIYYHPKDKSPTICFPADDTPLLCQFKSSKRYRSTEPDFTVNYIFGNDKRVNDIVVVRSYYGVAKHFTTNPTQPANNLRIENNLTTGSTIKDFDSTYGEGQIEDGPDVPEDWPLSLLYFDKKSKSYFYVGIDIGNMSWKEVNSLKNDRKNLWQYKAGIIYKAIGIDTKH